MTEITLVRHGQANSGATDEETYDRLSSLGHEQARWLGQHFVDTAQGFDHVLHGSLNRQRDTAAAICAAMRLEAGTDARLNELDYFGLAESLLATHSVPIPVGRDAFVAHVPMVLKAWREGTIATPLETYSTFENRVVGMLEDATAMGGRVLLVTSGGIISMMLRKVLGLDDEAHARILLNIHNSSVHRFLVESGRVLLDGFNAVPHLDHPERAQAKTYI